jgi:hypothetical protein
MGRDPITKALFGGGGDTTTINNPAPVRRDDPTANKSVDPNRSEAVAEARRRRLSLARRKGRTALRIDLADGSDQTRSGISIQ